MLPFTDNYDVNRQSLYMRGRFFLNGSGAIDNTQNQGRLFTATRTGVGTLSLKLLVPAPEAIVVATLSKAAILNRLFHELGGTKGTDGMWTFLYALTDLNNAGVVAAEWAAANAAAYISFVAGLRLGAVP